MNDKSLSNPAQRFAAGFFSPFSAARFLLRQPGLLRFVLIPLSINVMVFAGAVWGGLHLFSSIVARYLPQGEAWYWILLTYLLWVVAVLLTLVLVFFCFTAVGNLIAAPFNDLLSERTEELLIGRSLSEPFSLRSFMRDGWRILLEQGKRIFVFLLGMGLLLLLNLLPGVGTLLYAGLSVGWAVVFLSVEYTSYIADRKRMGFAAQRRYLFGHKLLMAGFGCGLLCLLAVPFLQLLCIPLGVVAATRLWCSHPPRDGEMETGR